MIFFTGFLVGVASLIPGVSGGTILVLTKKYDLITNAISHYKKKENILLIFFLVLGIIVGTICFARIIELLFYFFPNGIMIIFSGFILFHLPKLIKEEKEKPKLLWFFLGMLLIYLLSFFASDVDKVIVDYPKLTPLFLLYFGFCGSIDGFFTIIPGISGSMMMMLLGPYFLYKSFLAGLSFSTIYLAIPLFFYFIGDAFGFYLGSKFSIYFINKCRRTFFSIIFGMVLMSAILILPIPIFTQTGILSYLSFLLISYIFYRFISNFM